MIMSRITDRSGQRLRSSSAAATPRPTVLHAVARPTSRGVLHSFKWAATRSESSLEIDIVSPRPVLEEEYRYHKVPPTPKERVNDKLSHPTMSPKSKNQMVEKESIYPTVPPRNMVQKVEKESTYPFVPPRNKVQRVENESIYPTVPPRSKVLRVEKESNNLFASPRTMVQRVEKESNYPYGPLKNKDQRVEKQCNHPSVQPTRSKGQDKGVEHKYDCSNKPAKSNRNKEEVVKNFRHARMPPTSETTCEGLTDAYHSDTTGSLKNVTNEVDQMCVNQHRKVVTRKNVPNKIIEIENPYYSVTPGWIREGKKGGQHGGSTSIDAVIKQKWIDAEPVIKKKWEGILRMVRNMPNDEKVKRLRNGACAGKSASCDNTTNDNAEDFQETYQAAAHGNQACNKPLPNRKPWDIQHDDQVIQDRRIKGETSVNLSNIYSTVSKKNSDTRVAHQPANSQQIYRYKIVIPPIVLGCRGNDTKPTDPELSSTEGTTNDEIQYQATSNVHSDTQKEFISKLNKIQLCYQFGVDQSEVSNDQPEVSYGGRVPRVAYTSESPGASYRKPLNTTVLASEKPPRNAACQREGETPVQMHSSNFYSIHNDSSTTADFDDRPQSDRPMISTGQWIQSSRQTCSSSLSCQDTSTGQGMQLDRQIYPTCPRIQPDWKIYSTGKFVQQDRQSNMTGERIQPGPETYSSGRGMTVGGQTKSPGQGVQQERQNKLTSEKTQPGVQTYTPCTVMQPESISAEPEQVSALSTNLAAACASLKQHQYNTAVFHLKAALAVYEGLCGVRCTVMQPELISADPEKVSALSTNLDAACASLKQLQYNTAMFHLNTALAVFEEYSGATRCETPAAVTWPTGGGHVASQREECEDKPRNTSIATFRGVTKDREPAPTSHRSQCADHPLSELVHSDDVCVGIATGKQPLSLKLSPYRLEARQTDSLIAADRHRCVEETLRPGRKARPNVPARLHRDLQETSSIQGMYDTASSGKSRFWSREHSRNRPRYSRRNGRRPQSTPHRRRWKSAASRDDDRCHNRRRQHAPYAESVWSSELASTASASASEHKNRNSTKTDDTYLQQVKDDTSTQIDHEVNDTKRPHRSARNFNYGERENVRNGTRKKTTLNAWSVNEGAIGGNEEKDQVKHEIRHEKEDCQDKKSYVRVLDSSDRWVEVPAGLRSAVDCHYYERDTMTEESATAGKRKCDKSPGKRDLMGMKTVETKTKDYGGANSNGRKKILTQLDNKAAIVDEEQSSEYKGCGKKIIADNRKIKDINESMNRKRKIIFTHNSGDNIKINKNKSFYGNEGAEGVKETSERKYHTVQKETYDDTARTVSRECKEVGARSRLNDDGREVDNRTYYESTRDNRVRSDALDLATHGNRARSSALDRGKNPMLPPGGGKSPSFDKDDLAEARRKKCGTSGNVADIGRSFRSNMDNDARKSSPGRLKKHVQTPQSKKARSKGGGEPVNAAALNANCVSKGRTSANLLTKDGVHEIHQRAGNDGNIGAERLSRDEIVNIEKKIEILKKVLNVLSIHESDE